MEDWDADLSPCNIVTTHFPREREREAAFSLPVTLQLPIWWLPFNIYLHVTSRPWGERREEEERGVGERWKGGGGAGVRREGGREGEGREGREREEQRRMEGGGLWAWLRKSRGRSCLQNLVPENCFFLTWWHPSFACSVSFTCQICFLTQEGFCEPLVADVNKHLPDDVRCFSAARVPNNFDAKHVCSWREYLSGSLNRR